MKLFAAALLTVALLLSAAEAPARSGASDHTHNPDSMPTLVYVYDGLCGWCYGFSPVLTRYYEQHKDRMRFEVVSGGMITGERVGPIGEVAPYIKWAYKDVEKATGVVFGVAFLQGVLEKGTAVFTSMPPSVALTVFKTDRPDDVVPFAAALQKAIYFDGIEPLDYAAYGRLAAGFGLDAAAFVEQMQDQVYLNATFQEFSLAQQLGVTGFPTVFVRLADGRYQVVSRGYCDYDTLESRVEAVLAR